VCANAAERVRLVQGSHIVVKKIFEHDRCYIFQNADDRIIFAIPYERDFTLIGTTDLDYTGAPGAVRATPGEIAYLCNAASEYFSKPVRETDVVWTYSGVRPLYDDGASKAQEATRDYVLTLEGGEGRAPLLSVFGGKITTYRRLAEAALDKLSPFIPAGAQAKRGWTGAAALPGGDFATDGFDALVDSLRAAYPFLAQTHARRLARAYGAAANKILAGAKALADLGQTFGADVTKAEVDYLMREEWAARADDVLWRRSKLGLRVSAAEAAALDAYMAARMAAKENTAGAAA
jgi:glycerol-3-phosphate dehydrogenase